LSDESDIFGQWWKRTEDAIEEIKQSFKLPSQQVIGIAIGSDGTKEFTPVQMLEAIIKEDQYGKQLTKMFHMRNGHADEVFNKKIALQAATTETKIDSKKTTQAKKRKKPALIGKSKNLLLIRPNYQDVYVNRFAHPGSDLILSEAQKQGWNITDLDGDLANPDEVQKVLKNKNIDFVVHCDHGNIDEIYGQDHGNKKTIISSGKPSKDSANVAVLKGKALSTVSCLTALNLGPKALDKGARAYLGYWNVLWAPSGNSVPVSVMDKFIEAAIAPNLALLQGKTFQEAYNFGLQTYWLKYQEILGISVQTSDLLARAAILFASGFMLSNMACFALVRNPRNSTEHAYT
jgi:hypothetical protein